MRKSNKNPAQRKTRGINRSLRGRLNRHFLACSATAAAAGAGSAEAGIIYRSVNANIPVDNNGGLFLDLDTGAFGTGNSIAGYDLNFFEQAGTQLLQLRTPNNGVNGAFGFTNGPYTYVSNVALNTQIPSMSCAATVPGLVSLYSLESNANDNFGSNNASATNAITFVPGRVGRGVTFGSGGYIDIPDSATLDNQHLTVAAWVRPDGPGPNNDSAGMVVLAKEINVGSGIQDSFFISWRATDGRFFVDVYGSSVTSTHSFPAGQFYLVALTYDGTTAKLYVNGVLEGQVSQTSGITYDHTIPYSIGSNASVFRNSGFPRTWNGVIDELAIYNRALSQAELQSLGTCTSSLPLFVPYGILAAVDSNGAGPRHGPWVNGVTGGYVGFRFKSAQNATLYGWARLNVFAGLVPNNGSVGTLVDYAYDDSGAPIVVGQLPIPVISTQPTAQTVFLGDLASFTAASTNVPSTIKWQVSTDGGGSFTDISGATSATLTFRPVATQSGNLYRIVFTGSAGSAFSNAVSLTVISTDTDGDGMTDHFEDLYGLNKNDPTDANKDKDGDGMTNLQEFQAGTNPNDPTSVFRITAVSETAGVGTIRFTTITYKNYRVEKNDDLSNANGWSLLILVPGTGSEVQVTDPTAGSAPQGRRFYRVTVEPQQLSIPVVSMQPLPQTIFLGDLASFTGSSTNAPSTAKWQVSTNGGGLFADISGATSGTYTFRPVAAASGNLYRIVFTNSAGSTSSNAALLTVISTDTDGDGMTDHFEDLYGLNKNDPTDANKDKDGDGLTNLQEFKAGTNPNDHNSVFHVTGLSESAGIATIRFTTIVYKNYRVEKNDDLANANGWSLLSLTAGSGSEVQITDPTAGSAPQGRRFYRVTVEPQP